MGYAKQETIRKQQKLVSKSQRNKRKVLVNVFKVILVMIVIVIIAGAGAAFGMMKGILDNAPDVNKINIVPKGFKSVIYDANGRQERELSTSGSNREYVYYEDIPEDVVNAFVAIEDERFWSHNGIDVKSILRAGLKGVATGQFDEGASTLTQQLIKNQVFNVGMNETTFMDKLERKIQEQYLALELEKKYTKEQIVEYYLNTINLGRSAYGVKAAAEQYFGKELDELTISEIASIAGITQNPYSFDPVAYPEDSGKRRMMVLKKMLELDYITQAEYDEACADDVYTRIAEYNKVRNASETVTTYYQDAILNQLVKDFVDIYGCTEDEASTMIYTGGYSIYSVQDKDIQNICDTVINDPDYIGSTDKVGLSYQLTLTEPDTREEHNYGTGDLIRYYIKLTGNDKYNEIYANEDAARAAADQFKEAMLDETGYQYYDETFVVSPQPQFSFTIMDQKTGYVKAIVGGRGTKTVNRGLNRATGSPRQPGSTFKVVSAYLPLIDTGLGCLATPFKDEPTTYANGSPLRNWNGVYKGNCSVRTAIQNSMNILAVKAITKVTPEVAYDYLIDLGFTTLVDSKTASDGTIMTDKTQSAALGGLTYGVTTFEMTAAYGCIANGGLYTKPVLYSKVVDHDGNIVIDNTTPTTHRVIKETTAFQLIEAMKSVVNSGTGTPARMQSGITCAGKTGTTSSNYDLWFCGMTPYYTASIWMGYDSNINLGGGSAHKYMWRDIMDQIAVMEGQDPSVDFNRPEGISTITLCQISGKIPIEGCPTFTDYCASDFSPGGTCTGHVSVEICMDSKKVATSQCPNRQSFVIEEDPETGEKTFADAPEDIPYTEEICPLHPEGDITITSSAGEGGTITASQTVARGSTVTFYITPASGYSISDVIVNGASVGPVSSYTFENVQDNATISASFVASGGGTPPGPTTTEPPSTEPPSTEPPSTDEPSPPQ